MQYNKDIKEWTLEFAILMIKFSEELKKELEQIEKVIAKIIVNLKKEVLVKN